MKSVCILSGGMDSATLLYMLKEQGEDVYALTFDYGQRHKKEIISASKLASVLDVYHEIVDISDIKKLLKGSALTDDVKVPEGHYEEESMKLTVVPNRNSIMLSIAVAYAVSIKAERVYFAVHAGDHTIYPDCRGQFIALFAASQKRANYHPVTIMAPLLHMDKGDIVRIGLDLEVPYEITWTCYKGKEKACGKCGACTERLEAFKKAGIKDPLEYERYEDKKAENQEDGKGI